MFTSSDGTKHSKIGASSMARWSNCPGSVQLSEIAPLPPENEHAILGTLAHEVASFILEEQIESAPDEVARAFKIDNKKAQEILKAVSQYVDYFNKIYESSPKNKCWVEHSFDMAQVYPGAFGTADGVIYEPEAEKVHVIDYKHGAGILVEAKDNLQLQYYALGALETLKLPCKVVQMTIVQPRCFHPKGPIRHWEVPITHFIDFEEFLVEKASLTDRHRPAFKEGAHCIFCPGINICPIKEKALEAKAKNRFTPVYKSDPKDDFEPIVGD